MGRGSLHPANFDMQMLENRDSERLAEESAEHDHGDPEDLQGSMREVVAVQGEGPSVVEQPTNENHTLGGLLSQIASTSKARRYTLILLLVYLAALQAIYWTSFGQAVYDWTMAGVWPRSVTSIAVMILGLAVILMGGEILHLRVRLVETRAVASRVQELDAAVARAEAAERRVKELAFPEDLTHYESTILLMLAASESMVKSSDLRAQLNIGQDLFGLMIGRLVERGLSYRAATGRDGEQYLTTQKGREYAYRKLSLCPGE